MSPLPTPGTGNSLIGRTAETAALTAAVDAMRSGTGGVVEIAGDPGTGKSRLLGVLAELARAAGARVADAHTASGGRPSHPALHALLHGDDTTTQDEPPPDRVRAALTEWARPSGGVLLLDDFHLCPPASAGLVTQLIRTPVPAPLVVVLAHRPRQTDPAVLDELMRGTETGAVRRITPAPLTEDDVRALLAPSKEHRPVLAGYSYAGLLRDAAEGNPRYLRVLASAYWCPLGWPASVGSDREGLLQEAAPLTAEVGRLPPAAREAAAAAAVLGDPFRPQDVALLTGTDQQDTLAAIAALTHADVVRPLNSGGRFAFRHPVVRHVVLENTCPTRRLPWHREAFDLLSGHGATAATRAGHAEHVIGTDSAGALPALIDGAAEVVGTAPRTAARWLRLAVESLPADWDGPDRATLSIACCRALIASGALDQARALAHEVLHDGAALEPAKRLEMYAVCVDAERQLGRYQEAEAIAHAALSLLPSPLPDPLPAEAAELVFNCGLVHALKSRHEQARALAAAALRTDIVAGRVGRTSLRVLEAFADAYLGDLETARPKVDDIARLVDALPDPDAGHAPEILALLGCAEIYLEQVADASRHLHRGLAEASGGNQQHIRLHQLIGLAIIEQSAGRLDRAEQYACDAEELARRIGASDAVGLTMTIRASTAMWTRPAHEMADALTLAERGIANVAAGQGWWSKSAAGMLAQSQFMAGDAAGCLRTLHEHGGGAGLPLLQPAFRPALLSLMSLAALKSGAADARSHLRDAWAAAERLGLPAQRGCVQRAEAVLLSAEGNHQEAVPLFEAAAEAFRRAAMPVQYAWTLVNSAASLRAVRGERAASAALDIAVREAERCGAVRIVDDALRVGESVTPRPAEVTGQSDLGPLSSREREIALLVASGMRSRQIAEKLFLSTRTIDSHLNHIYRKLHISSRTELAKLLYQEYVSGGV